MNDDKYLTVTALTRYIKYKIDNDAHLQNVYLRGEISNFKAHTRGHYYFTIKDETSRISAIMFSSKASTLKFVPEDGMKVLLRGKISVFESTGNYQIYVEEILEDGLGNLHIAFEQLKSKLSKEGLFDDKYKKLIPRVPMRVGIITAPTGAAVKDIISTIKRRFPICETILFPCLVQGAQAKGDIVNKIEIADTYNLDVIILGRGGGSIEDLWPFNEEEVARAIFSCKTPIISAVGHEIDFTISDFVADLRAETPTGAAERAVPELRELLDNIFKLTNRSNEVIKNILIQYRLKLKKISESYILKNPMKIYQEKELKLDNIIDKLIVNMKTIIVDNKNNLDKNIEKLILLNPLNALKRGYAIVSKDNKAISNAKNIKVNDKLEIKITGARVKTKVEEVIINEG